MPNENLLRGKHLWGYVDGLKMLTGGASNSEEEKFQEWLDEAHMLITMAISKTQMCLVTSCETVVESWKAFATHVQRNTRENFRLLMRKLFKLEMTEGGSPKEHFLELKETTD